jgi:FtsP/CotA-like multicopper oxidase with cupredoxin domain
MSKKRSVYSSLSVFAVVLIVLLESCTAITPTSLPQTHATSTPDTDHSNMDGTKAPSNSAQPVAGCEIQTYLLNSKGTGKPFSEPEIIESVNGVLNTTLTVEYGNNIIGECPVYLRSYNGKLVGPTLRARPGDTLRITLRNELPKDDPNMPHHVMNTLGDFNHTNLHTHGLHVSPAGNSDNVLLDIKPGESFEYEIKIPKDHVPGTFWYHAHMHGSTATQLASGMEGALIIMGDQIPGTIDSVPEVKNAADRIFVFQQIIYDEAGELEPQPDGTGTFPSSPDPNNPIQYFGPCSWEPMKREHLINGQLFPVLEMVPAEVQRWRFIDAGIRESIGVQLIGPYPFDAKINVIDDVYDREHQQPVAPGKFVKLNEIALDGIPLTQVDAWDQVDLEPGYRSDVMVQLDKPGKYFLVDTGVQQTIVTRDRDTLEYKIETKSSAALTCSSANELPNFLATINVPDVTKKNMDLPTTAQLAQVTHLKNIIEINPAKKTKGGEPIDPNSEDFVILASRVQINAFQKVDFSVSAHPPLGSPNPGPVLFMAADHPFDLQNPRRLILGNTDEWILNTQEDSLYYAHPFHIHVNPFQTWRFGPDGKPETIWRDTILVRQGVTTYVFTRYEDYIGQFVYHCHILDHEDQGMMELLEVVNP